MQVPEGLIQSYSQRVRAKHTPEETLSQYLVKVEGQCVDREEHHPSLLHPRVHQVLEEQNLKAIDTVMLGAVQGQWKISSQLCLQTHSSVLCLCPHCGLHIHRTGLTEESEKHPEGSSFQNMAPMETRKGATFRGGRREALREPE